MRYSIVRVGSEIKERLKEVNDTTLRRFSRLCGQHMILQSVICRCVQGVESSESLRFT